MNIAGEVKSGVALLEAVVKEYEQTIGMKNSKIVAASKRANSLFETLSTSEKEQVRPIVNTSDLSFSCSNCQLIYQLAFCEHYQWICALTHPTLASLYCWCLQVKAARKQKGLVQRVLLAFEEELASRQLPSALYNYESWDEQGTAWLGDLLPDG